MKSTTAMDSFQFWFQTRSISTMKVTIFWLTSNRPQTCSVRGILPRLVKAANAVQICKLDLDEFQSNNQSVETIQTRSAPIDVNQISHLGRETHSFDIRPIEKHHLARMYQRKHQPSSHPIVSVLPNRHQQANLDYKTTQKESSSMHPLSLDRKSQFWGKAKSLEEELALIRNLALPKLAWSMNHNFHHPSDNRSQEALKVMNRLMYSLSKTRRVWCVQTNYKLKTRRISSDRWAESCRCTTKRSAKDFTLLRNEINFNEDSTEMKRFEEKE